MAVFGHSIKDFIPILPGKYMPHDTWKTTLEAQEEALRNRHMNASEYWTEHTKKLPPVVVGDHVIIQNQISQNALKWYKTGKVFEVKQYDQYAIRVDGSRRITLRNRKFLRKLISIQQDHSCIPMTIDQYLLNKCNTQNPENARKQDQVHYKTNYPEYDPITEQEQTETPVVIKESAQAPNSTELYEQDLQSSRKSDEQSSQAIYHHNDNSRQSERTRKTLKWMEDYITE